MWNRPQRQGALAPGKLYDLPQVTQAQNSGAGRAKVRGGGHSSHKREKGTAAATVPQAQVSGRVHRERALASLSLQVTADEFRGFFLRKTEQPLSVSNTVFCSRSHIPGIRAPMHGINFGQVPPQRSPGAHLDSSHWVDVVCDLKK